MAKRPAKVKHIGDFRHSNNLTVKAINPAIDAGNEDTTDVLTSVENQTGPTYQPLPQIAKHFSLLLFSVSFSLSLEQSILHRPIFSY